jgi:hypothetical protein
MTTGVVREPKAVGYPYMENPVAIHMLTPKPI